MSTDITTVSDEQKLLAACGDYRANLDKLEADKVCLEATVGKHMMEIIDLKVEKVASRWEKSALEVDVVFWHKAYCSVGKVLGVKEPELAGGDVFAELVKELVAKNAALKTALDQFKRRTP